MVWGRMAFYKKFINYVNRRGGPSIIVRVDRRVWDTGAVPIRSDVLFGVGV